MILMPTNKNIEACVRTLAEGNLLGMPTETVYGLAGLAENNWSVKEIFRQKGRPSHNPLICHVGGLEQFHRYVELPDKFHNFIKAYAPQSVTFVLPLKKGHTIAPAVLAGGDTLALRIPSHPVAQKLLKELGRPVAAPSANISCRVSPTQAEDVEKAFPHLPVLDGGFCALGLESSVVDLTGNYPIVLRPGHCFSKKGALLPDGHYANLQHAHFSEQAISQKSVLRSPGLLSKHYAPDRPVMMNISHPSPGQAYICFGPHSYETQLDQGVFNLSYEGDIKEAAQQLYHALHALDKEPFTSIAVAPLPQDGLGQVIDERLKRASASSVLEKIA